MKDATLTTIVVKVTSAKFRHECLLGIQSLVLKFLLRHESDNFPVHLIPCMQRLIHTISMPRFLSVSFPFLRVRTMPKTMISSSPRPGASHLVECNVDGRFPQSSIRKGIDGSRKPWCQLLTRVRDVLSCIRKHEIMEGTCFRSILTPTHTSVHASSDPS